MSPKEQGVRPEAEKGAELTDHWNSLAHNYADSTDLLIPRVPQLRSQSSLADKATS